MQISEINLGTNIMNLGAMLGTAGSQKLIDQINARSGGGSFFNTNEDPFKEGFQTFIDKIAAPNRQLAVTLAQTANKLFAKDEFRALTTREDLRTIPPCMHLPLIYFQPMRTMLEEERIDGFGIDPTTLADEDPYEKMCKSGVVEIHSSLLDKEGKFTVTFYESTTDPDLTPDQVAAIRSSREFLQKFIEDEETRHFDPTNYPALHC